ncbi:hypothetical protein ILUMI_08146 [Ignelater luminosus]|uniref:Uncharacterized protein n=1 Tax=Ignelater luminosus TaxID=2038154 RepID=A0A8K0D2H4_IGNLU|nr:hypothetical protein ILUMI_08146 [Ignelater luminosus]
MGCKTVICIDTSGSTSGNDEYFEKIKKILESETDKIIITWNSKAQITESEQFDSDGCTEPQTFLNIIKEFKYDYNLIVTTDGQVSDDDVRECKAIIESCNILDRIQSFKMYFIGHTGSMNLRISSPFNKLKNKQIIINDDEPINVIDINLVEELKYEDFKDEKTIVASILTLLQTHPDKRNELRSQICKVANRIIGDLASKSSIKEFYDKNDIDGCVEFVKKYDNSEKKIFQQSMSIILAIFKTNDDYSLSHLANTNVCQKQQIKASNMDYDEEEISDQDFICDILLTKCGFPCILVKLVEDSESSNQDKFSIIPYKLSKKIAEHPFLILKHDDIIQKIVKRVEHQMIDLYAYNSLEDKSRSPFTRDTLKGVFIFHNDEADHDLIFKNNNRTISFIFGKDNKLPGNKVIWNILFLYILIKYHPAWKEHENKLKDEILYICKNVPSLITLTPLLNPTISENFEVCFWYIFNVAPKAFENTSSNVLRFLEGSDEFLKFHSYLSGQNLEKMNEKLKIWNLWKYFSRNRVNKNLKLEVLSQIQNHEVINDSIVLLSGNLNSKNEHSSECVCKKFNVEPEIVINLYNIFKKKSNPKLYDYVDFNAIHKDENKIPTVVIKDNFNDELLKHVSICITTCQPTVICPVTGKHWKECSGSYDVNTESYVRQFKRFCLAKGCYPKDVNELLVFYSNRINFNSNDVMVCPLNIKTCLQIVLDKYSDVVKKYPLEEYLDICDTECSEVERLEIEKTCNICDCHKQIDPEHRQDAVNL